MGINESGFVIYGDNKTGDRVVDLYAADYGNRYIEPSTARARGGRSRQGRKGRSLKPS